MQAVIERCSSGGVRRREKGERGELLETYNEASSWCLVVLEATLRFRRSFSSLSLQSHSNSNAGTVRVEMQVERKRKSGNGSGVGSRLSGGGWEGRLGLKGKVARKCQVGSRCCLTFLSTFEEVVEEEIGEVGGIEGEEERGTRRKRVDWTGQGFVALRRCERKRSGEDLRPGKDTCTGYSVLTSRTVQVASPAPPVGIRRGEAEWVTGYRRWQWFFLGWTYKISSMPHY